MRNQLLEFCEFSCIGPVTNYADRPVEQLPDRELWDCLVRASRSHTQPLTVLRVARTSVWVAEETVQQALWMEYRHFEREDPGQLRSIEDRLGVVPGSEHEMLDLVYIVLAARRAETGRDLKDGARENAINDDPVGTYWTPCWVTGGQLMQLVASNTLTAMRTLAAFDPVVAASILTTAAGLPTLMESSMKIVMGCGDPRTGQPAIIGKPEGPWMRVLQRLLGLIGVVTARPRGRYPRSYAPQALAKRASRSRATSYAAMKSALKRGLAMADDEGLQVPGGRGCHRLLDRLRDSPRPVTWRIGTLRHRRTALAKMRIE